MSTFFNSPKEASTEVPADLNKDTTAITTSPTLATYNALPSDTNVFSQKGESSKPSSEKESTLVDEPIRNSTAAEDTNKEMTTENQPPEVVPNEDSSKESVPKNDTEKDATKDEDKSGSDDDADKAKEPKIEYPTAFRLLLITIALCLCVFCVALVRHLLTVLNMMIPAPSRSQYPQFFLYRTTQSLQPPSQRSPINSTLSTMSVGTVVPTCSLPAPSP
jgi:hypothetical protein